jgi:hypothetical protein
MIKLIGINNIKNGSIFENHYMRKKILDYKIKKLGRIIKNTREKN